jgi:hypothetical protein
MDNGLEQNAGWIADEVICGHSIVKVKPSKDGLVLEDEVINMIPEHRLKKFNEAISLLTIYFMNICLILGNFG